MKRFNAFLQSKSFLVLVFLVFLYIQGTQSDRYYHWVHPEKRAVEHSSPIFSDGSGYYAYLPQWYVYNKNGFSFLPQVCQKYNTSEFIQGIGYNYKENKGVNKYYPGTAFCSTPIFLLTHGINKVCGKVSDGYSLSYQFATAINGLLYWFLGALALLFLMKRKGLNNWQSLLLIGLLTFGTNLNFYAVYFPSFSHVYSFAAISWFVLYAYKWKDEGTSKNFILMCALLGLVFSIRPTNILIITILPFVFGGFKLFGGKIYQLLTTEKMQLSIGLGIFILFVFAQLLNVHVQTGEWKLNTYTEEHFDFLTDPQIFNVLFSYKKGFFVYAPVMLLIFPGMYFFLKKELHSFLLWLLPVSLFLYLTAAWWCWWYGGGLGMRPLIDILVLWLFPLIYMLKVVKKWGILLFVMFTGCTVWMYQVFQKQYNVNIIHYDLMDRTNFWRVFMKTDLRYSWSAAFVDEQLPQDKPKNQKSVYFHSRDGKFYPQVESQKKLYFFNPQGNGITYAFIPDSACIGKIGIEISGKMQIGQPESNPCCTVSYYKSSKVIKESKAYIGYRIQELNKLTSFRLRFYPHLKFSEIDSIVVNQEKGEVPTAIKNFGISFYGY